MSTPEIAISPETSEDFARIHHVNETAFGQPEEANLVDALREDGQSTLSLVAIAEGQIVGHILFCKIQIQAENKTLDAISLSPMAVLPEFQKRGIGTLLVNHGLGVLRAQGESVVTVLGHPKYYPRFGFRPAQDFQIQCPYEVPPEAWMLLELQPGVLRRELGEQSAIVVYPAAYAQL